MMNNIDVRTDKGEYRGGDIIYGAVYLNVTKPLYATNLILVIEGCEECAWYRERLNQDKESSQSSENETPLKESFDGSKQFLFGKYILTSFEDGAVPLGVYAYPFQVPLNLELPNSFCQKESIDDVKETSYHCSVSYSLSAKFTSSSGSEDKRFMAQQLFNIVTDLSSKRASFKLHYPSKRMESEIDVCCCLKQGALILNAEIEKFTYKLGSDILVKYSIKNSSSSVIKQCVITLARIIKLVGKPGTSNDNEGSKVVNGFYEVVEQVVHDFELKGNDTLARELFIPLKRDNRSQLASTTGDLVKCLYQLEVDVKVPWDADASLELPVTVNVTSNQQWLEWKVPEWAAELTIKKSMGQVAVPDRLLVSKLFSNVPLPIRGKVL